MAIFRLLLGRLCDRQNTPACSGVEYSTVFSRLALAPHLRTYYLSKSAVPWRAQRMRVVLILFVMFFAALKISSASTSPFRTCAQLYVVAADALDNERSTCGLSNGDKGLSCTISVLVSDPFAYRNIELNIDIGARHWFLHHLGWLSNKIERSSRLIAQGYASKGLLVKRMHRRIARKVPDVSFQQVAQKIRQADADGSLCADNTVSSIAGIQKILIHKFETEGQFGLP